MSQEHHIVRCFNCETFQVDIVKKSTNKWQCKMCGEKQSLKQAFGTSSSAKDLRDLCQQLNEKRGEMIEERQLVNNIEPPSNYASKPLSVSRILKTGNESRWSKYLVKENPKE